MLSDNALLDIPFMLLLSCEELVNVLTCASEIHMASERQDFWQSMISIFHDEAAVT